MGGPGTEHLLGERGKSARAQCVGGTEPRPMSQSTGRSFKSKSTGGGRQEADDGDVGKAKIMNCRENNSQNELAALRLHSTVVG